MKALLSDEQIYSCEINGYDTATNDEDIIYFTLMTSNEFDGVEGLVEVEKQLRR